MNDRFKEAFDQIHAEEELKRSVRRYLYCRTNGYTGGRTLAVLDLLRRRFAVAVACVFLVLSGFCGYVSYFTQTSVISIDVNPSFELGINRFDRVISVKGYNKDGSRIVSGLDIRFLNYMDALDRILEDEGMTPYLTADQFVSLTVVGDNKKKCDEMLEHMNTSASSACGNVHCYSADTEELSQAHHSGMSYGKYNAYLELKELAPDITEDDVRELSMCQIRDWTAELSGGGLMDDGSYDDKDEERGNGHRHGHGPGHGH